MRVVPVTLDDNGSINVPETPWPPANALAVHCDGANFTVYEPGDTVPVPGEPASDPPAA